MGNAIINLIDEPGKISNGSIVLDGIDIHEDPKNIAKYRGKKIGLIFQDPQTSLNPIITIGEQLIETIQTHLSLTTEEPKNKAINLLKEGGIKDAETRFDNYPHQFSGEWWITFFPAIFLVILAFSINLLGDWMRDTLNPKLN